MDPNIIQAAIDTAVTMGATSAALIAGYAGGYKDRKKAEKVEKHNKEVEGRNDKRSLKY